MKRTCISMLLALKDKALDEGISDAEEMALFKATNCGKFALASKIDEILKEFLDIQTDLANYKYLYKVASQINSQWENLGFLENPEDMTKQQIAELKTIAKRFYPDDQEET